MAVLPKIDSEGDLLLELLPRVRYMVKVNAENINTHFFENGVLFVPTADSNFFVAVNLSDRMATSKCKNPLKKIWRSGTANS